MKGASRRLALQDFLRTSYSLHGCPRRCHGGCSILRKRLRKTPGAILEHHVARVRSACEPSYSSTCVHVLPSTQCVLINPKTATTQCVLLQFNNSTLEYHWYSTFLRTRVRWCMCTLHNHTRGHVHFVPFVVETEGYINRRAHLFLDTRKRSRMRVVGVGIMVRALVRTRVLVAHVRTCVRSRRVLQYHHPIGLSHILRASSANSVLAI